MAKNSFYVNLLLESPQCTMISPGYEYIREDAGMPKKKEWDSEHLIRLEKLISDTMIARHQQELMEILENKLPTLYIDCCLKGDDDILQFIFKEYIKHSNAQHKADIVNRSI